MEASFLLYFDYCCVFANKQGTVKKADQDGYSQLLNPKPGLVDEPNMEKGSRHKLLKQGIQTERSNNFLPLKTKKCKLAEQTIK